MLDFIGSTCGAFSLALRQVRKLSLYQSSCTYTSSLWDKLKEHDKDVMCGKISPM